MSRNPEKDALQAAETKQRILEAGYRLFSERTVESVSMNEVARASDVGIATLYRYFTTKSALVLAIAVRVWETRILERVRFLEARESSAGEEFAVFLESFLNLYREHKELLRFNQFFNVYVQNERIPPELMAPYGEMIRTLADRFHKMYEKGRVDGTLRTELPEKEMFSCTLHLMLAAVTRYAMGLVYNEGTRPEEELLLLKNMLLREFVPDADFRNTAAEIEKNGAI